MTVIALFLVLALWGIATVFGIYPTLKLIQIYEAQHELKRDSAGWLRMISGWSLIVFWGMSVWFISTILGDWIIHQDLDAALARAWWRLRILLEIAAQVMEADS